MASLNVLHVIGQRPEMTGSGVYVESMIRESGRHAIATHLVAGVPAGHAGSGGDGHPGDRTYLLFETEELDFPVPGMSDVMPYKSSRFKELTGDRLTAYTTAFGRVLETVVATFQPDIIHTNHLFVLTAAVRKQFPNLPVVTTCHGTDLRQYTNCEHLRAFVKRHCRGVDRIIALTIDQKRDIHRLLDIPEDRIVVVGGGYDETIFTCAPKSATAAVQILYAGKYNRSKGVPWLLKSLKRLTHRNWHLHMAGSGQGAEFDECIRLADALGPRVTDHGYITHRQLSRLMKIAHIQVLPSFFEGLPLVLFEGLASGCRIVTTRLTGFDEIFGGAKRDTIDLIPLPPLETIDRPFQRDENRLEACLSESISNMIDAVKKSPDVDDPAATSIASRYTWPRVFKRVRSVYNDLVQCG